jgi:hypothetical protein
MKSCVTTDSSSLPKTAHSRVWHAKSRTLASYEREADARFERAFRRWLSRVGTEHALTHEQAELLRAASGALDSPFRELALSVLVGTCRELTLPPPPLPP